jgi:hypothetical protein
MRQHDAAEAEMQRQADAYDNEQERLARAFESSINKQTESDNE